jgi:hypothetical protein
VSGAVEAAARAQARLLCAQGWTKEECDSFVDSRWGNYVPFARAAIASLRVPTEAMIQAGSRAVWLHAIDASELDSADFVRGWQAAIDTMLEEK